MDPILKTRIVSALKAEIPSFSPSLRTVAKYIVDFPSDFGLDTIRETARKCGVSTYTLVRMSHRMGFEGYEDMREPFRHALVSAPVPREHSEWINDLRGHGDWGSTQADAALNSVSIVQRSLSQQNSAQMARVVKILLEANTVYLTAVRASYGLAYYFNYVGRMALPSLRLIPRHMNSAIDELNEAEPGDAMIAITFAPYSRETIEACKFARNRGVQLIMVSDSDILSPEFVAEETLIASTVSTHQFGCYTGAMAILENLLAQLFQQGGEAANERNQKL